MKLKYFFLLFILGISAFCGAQNVRNHQFTYEYRLVRIDSTYDQSVDPSLEAYLQKKRSQLSKEMDVVIGHCPATMTSFAPQSPLSNFLTDLLLFSSASYLGKESQVRPDVSILNFGGIRAPIMAGDVTVGDIYAVSPFDNHLVFVMLKGSELKRVFDRFAPKADKACFAGVNLRIAADGVSVQMPDGSPVLDDQVYTLVTLDFIAEGGDNILSDIVFEGKVLTDVVFREFIINEIRKLESQGKPVAATTDNRTL